jgi:hypothetical protein
MINCDLATQTVDQLLEVEVCGCDSHRPADNTDGCQHCHAKADEVCYLDCPVGELDDRLANDELTSAEAAAVKVTASSLRNLDLGVIS